MTQSLASGLTVHVTWRVADLEPRCSESIARSTDGAAQGTHGRDARGDPGDGAASSHGGQREGAISLPVGDPEPP